MKRHMMVLLATLAMTGCKKEMTVWVTTTDIESAAHGKNALQDLTTILKVEVASSSICEEDGAQIVALIQQTLGKADNAKCERRGMESFLAVDTSLPLLAVPADQTVATFISTLEQHPTKGIVFLLAHRNADGEPALTPAVARGRVQKLNDTIEQSFERSGRNALLNSSSFSLTIYVDNPDKSPVTLRGRSVYHRDAALPIEGLATVNAGEAAPFRLSAIQTQYLFQSGGTSVPAIEVAQQATEKPGLLARLLAWIKNLFN